MTAPRTSETPFVTGAHGRLFYVRWRGRMTATAMHEVLGAMSEARRKADGPLVVVSVVPAFVALPGPKERSASKLHLGAVDQLTELILSVFEGTGFRQVFIRGVFNVYAYLLRTPLHACATEDEAWERAAARLHTDVASLRARVHTAP